MKENFLKSMRRLVYPVTIASSKLMSKKYAITVSSVTSLSLDPPALLVCINEDSSFSQCIFKDSYININFLNYRQKEIAVICSSSEKKSERFFLNDWEYDQNGVPFLKGCESIAFCQVYSINEFATHMVVALRVIDIRFNEKISSKPLLYSNGNYIKL